MNLQVKQRIIGGLVLLAIIAIFVPILFHSSHPTTDLTLSTEIPLAPAEPQIALPLPKLSQSNTQNTERDFYPETEHKKENTADALSSTELSDSNNANKQKVNFPTHPEPLAEHAKIPTKQMHQHAQRQVQQKIIHKSLTDKSITKSNSHHSLTASQAWVIQLATLSNKANAIRLVQNLRHQGFDTYMRIIKNSKGIQLTRVYVGPEIRLETIRRIQKKLQSQFHLNGLIRKYKV